MENSIASQTGKKYKISRISMRSITMALDQIWKQQLTLVTYGNAFLAQDLSFQRWVQHSIFNQHQFSFRDLNRQHLLAQHFQVWLEGLKKQGVKKLSLHNSHFLDAEQNPNPNVELLAYPHFIVSHHDKSKTAWICGKELAEWYRADNDYEAPVTQTNPLRHETLWSYELNTKLSKRLESDFQTPQWDEIQLFLNNELFEHPLAEGFQNPAQYKSPYTGILNTQTQEWQANDLAAAQALFPTDAQADFAHQTLHRLDGLTQYIHEKAQHPYHADGSLMQPEEQLELRHFAQKIDDLWAKFIVKVANHYETAQLTKVSTHNPLEGASTPIKPELTKAAASRPEAKGNNASAIKLIVITVIICAIAYYFGL